MRSKQSPSIASVVANLSLSGLPVRRDKASKYFLAPLFLTFAAAASAQPAEKNPRVTQEITLLDPIISTARKVEEDLWKVPESITSVSSDQISSNPLQAVQAVAAHSPNMN